MTDQIADISPTRYRSLRFILSWQFILVALLPLITVGLLHIQQMDTIIHADAKEKHRLLASAITRQVSFLFQGPTLTLYGVYPDIQPDATDNIHSLDNMLDGHAINSDLVESILLLDPSGRVQAVGLRPEHRSYRNNYYGLEYGHHPFVQQAHHQQLPAWSQAFLSPTSGGIVVSVAIPIDDWTLIAEVNLLQLAHETQDLSEKGDILTIIIDSSGNTLVHPDPSRSTQMINLRNLSLVRQWEKGQVQTAEFTFDDITYFGSIDTIPDLNWGVIVAQPSEHVFRMIDNTRTLFIFGALFSFSLALFVALLLAKRFSSRVNTFVGTARQIATGYYDAEIPQPTDKEFFSLAQAIAQMRGAISDREQQLTDRERMYREVVENTRDLVTRVDSDGRFLYVNHTANEIFGLPPEECIGLSAFDFVHPDDRADTQHAFQSWTKENVIHAKLENRQVSRDGSTRLLSWTINLIRNHQGIIEEFSSIARDITKNRKNHEERLALETKLRQAQKMESVGHLAGGIAHDFNNILAAILGYTDLAENYNRKNNDPKLTHYHDRIREGGLRARDLVSQLLTYSHSTEGVEKEQIHVAPIIKEVSNLLQSTFPTSLSLQWRVDENLPEVTINPANLHQVLMHLVINARHAMDEKGDISISADQVHQTVQLKCNSCLQTFQGDFICIRVKDNGHGIDPLRFEQIFDPFFTSKERTQGTGLGLSVVHGIIHEVQGHIHIWSKLGKGSEFSIYLPVSNS